MRFQLPELTFPLVVDTIGKELALGQELHVRCSNNGCGRGEARLNLVALARCVDRPGHPGLDHPSGRDNLLPHLFCPECRRNGRPDRNLNFTLMNPGDFCAWPIEREQRRQEILRSRTG
ncbi:hypothetical protein MAUB1S_11489 [Mycolicibacterium aubagnense]